MDRGPHRYSCVARALHGVVGGRVCELSWVLSSSYTHSPMVKSLNIVLSNTCLIACELHLYTTFNERIFAQSRLVTVSRQSFGCTSPASTARANKFA